MEPGPAQGVLQTSLSGAPEPRGAPESGGFQLSVWTPLVSKRELKAKTEAMLGAGGIEKF